ncbi:MAG TPA: glycoside hydrolase family 97 N-terminal domain-containing protein, partial [Steroidobacteraceae bacterium]|nr:glycoside hydrolase family 97 N-terminal domain-containing protein [Steroidobacteraceae bacterium]
MSRIVPILIACLLLVATTGHSWAAASSYDLRSPDGRVEIRIRTTSQLRYDLVLEGRAILENCALSLDVEHTKLGTQAEVKDAKPSSHDEMIMPVVRQKFAKIRDHYNELRLNMEGEYAVVFRAYNEGAAYRFETSFPQ